jgi:hypothetical protein
MAKILTLDELAKIDDASEYGKKAEGLAKLQRIVSELKCPFPVSIPALFSVPVHGFGSETELKDAYTNLTKDFTEPKIILARSSDPEEQPGKFETHPSLYLPENADSFSNWMNAAKKVMDSGARAVIGQVLSGDLDDFYYDLHYDEKLERQYESLKAFGGSQTSFFAKTTDFIMGDYPDAVLCDGLASKIARGDIDICLMQSGELGLNIINLAHDYEIQSFAPFEQYTVDVIKLDSPEKISTIEISRQCHGNRMVFENCTIPFESYFMTDQDRELYPRDIFVLLKQISKEAGTDIEIEGSVDKKGVHLYQMRPYEMPSKYIDKLTEIPAEKQLAELSEKEMGWKVFGFNRLKGDLFVSNSKSDLPDNSILLYTGNIYDEKIRDFKKYKQLVIPVFKSEKDWSVYHSSHEIGRTIQVLYELEKLGVNAIAVHEGYIDSMCENIKKHQDRIERIDLTTIKCRNVTLESDGKNVQVFFND